MSKFIMEHRLWAIDVRKSKVNVSIKNVEIGFINKSLYKF